MEKGCHGILKGGGGENFPGMKTNHNGCVLVSKTKQQKNVPCDSFYSKNINCSWVGLYYERKKIHIQTSYC